jgi:ribosomal protein S27AE
VSGVLDKVPGMFTLSCPNGCGDLSVFLARRGRRQIAYTGCRTCWYTDWKGGSPATDISCADAFAVADPPVEYAVIDRVEGSDPYPQDG